MAESLHPILAKNNITPGTPEAVLAVAGYFVKLKYEEGPKKDNLFGRWYGINHTAWCAEFVTYCFTKAGAGYVVQNTQAKKGYISCGAGIRGLKKKGYKQVAVKDAQPGDIIFFDWEHDHDPDHTGIVLKNNPKKGTVVCREGNTSRGDGSRSNGGQVAERIRYYTNVFAVFRPEWKPVKTAVKAPVAPIEAPKAAEPVVAPATPVKAPVKATVAPKPKKPILSGYLKVGSKGANVRYLQTALGIKADGIFGKATHDAVVKLQAKNKLKADGIVGPLTWGKIK
jgi:hypothetical protein